MQGRRLCAHQFLALISFNTWMSSAWSATNRYCVRDGDSLSRRSLASVVLLRGAIDQEEEMSFFVGLVLLSIPVGIGWLAEHQALMNSDRPWRTLRHGLVFAGLLGLVSIYRST